VIGRSLYVGEPLTIPFHRLESGALLLFTFFMISDPKTTPDSRADGSSSRGRRVRRWYINYRSSGERDSLVARRRPRFSSRHRRAAAGGALPLARDAAPDAPQHHQLATAA